MRFAALSTAVVAALLCMGSAHAASTANAARLGFHNVTVGNDGRFEAMVGQTPLVAHGVDQLQGLLNGELGRLIGFSGDNSALVAEVSTTADGMTYYKLHQTYQGLRVWGDGVTVEAAADGRIGGIFGSALDVHGVNTLAPRDAASVFPGAVRDQLLADGAQTKTAIDGSRQFRFVRQPELVIYAANGHMPTLAWDADVAYTGPGKPFYARMFVDARSGVLLNSYTYVQESLNRSISNLDGKCVAWNDSSLPGPVALNEGGTSSDDIVNNAYRALGRVYWFFRNDFGRDSYDNNGTKLVSTVRATFKDNCGGDNAFWNGSQMLIGKGGSTFKDLTLNPDVTYHELGHGVTGTTSQLAYQYESGGLNEASSDIYASMVTAWVNTVSGEPGSSTAIAFSYSDAVWQVGEGLRQNGGGPLRYMNDPAADGRSLDHYSQYKGSSNYENCSFPSDSNDQCGVHTSSGIANLAWYLMNKGGQHPRRNNGPNVVAVPMERTAKYFYEAHTSVLQQNDGFSKMRNAMQARARANGGVGACDEVQVAAAWEAVGVTGTAPGNPSGCDGSGGTNKPPVASFTSSASGLTVNFDGSASSDSDGTVDSYAWDFGDSSSAGSGVKPSHTYSAGGDYTVKLTVTDNKGATNSTTKTVTVTGSGGDSVLENGVAKTGLKAAKDGSLRFTLAVPSGATNLKFVTSGGSGDADLYVKFGSAPSTTSNDCKSEGSTTAETCNIQTAQAGTYHVLVYAYSAIDGVSLTGSYSTGGSSNKPPVASFTSSASGLTVNFDGSASSDSDGSIASYAWDYGDSSSAGSGAKPSHTYAAAGTYTVKLTVTDDKGATNSTTKSVTVSGGGGGVSCSGGASYSGSLWGAGWSDYQPGYGGYSAAAGAQSVCLSGPSGANFDLYLEQQQSNFQWLVVAKSEGASATESLSYNGTAGTYRVRVVGVSGSGAYTLQIKKP